MAEPTTLGNLLEGFSESVLTIGGGTELTIVKFAATDGDNQFLDDEGELIDICEYTELHDAPEDAESKITDYSENSPDHAELKVQKFTFSFKHEPNDSVTTGSDVLAAGYDQTKR